MGSNGIHTVRADRSGPFRSRATLRTLLGSLVLVAAALPGGRSGAARTSSVPGTLQTPLQHVVIVLKENRSFDHYFGEFPGAEGALTGEMHDGTIVELAPALEPLPNDIDHNVTAFYKAYNNGQMNGFDLEDGAFSEDGQNLAYSQMSENQIPNYWAYARRYAIGDHMFSDFHGASFANNLFGVAAQAGRYDATIGNRSVYGNPVYSSLPGGKWGCDNPPDATVQMIGLDSTLSSAYPCFNFQALPNVLDQYGVSWNYYADKASSGFIHNSLDAIRSVRYNPNLWSKVVPFSQFETDALAGNLPSVSWVLGSNLEHPPETACDGENETVELMNAVMQGPDWSSTAIVIVWDEWGGFYDHEPPLQVDNISYGIRVPLIVISPWTKVGPGSDGGYISSTFYSHASFIKLIETNWGLPTLNERDAEANDMLDLFDFSSPHKSALLLSTRSCPALGPEQLAVLGTRDPD